jgi:5'-methylthioadenosine/S-adenosylhomocysteine nucleosidase
MKTVAIIGAMDSEIENYLNHFSEKTEENWNGITFHISTHKNHKLIIAKSGIGKVFAAMVCQRIIDNYGPEIIIFTGVAGSLNDKFNIGDVIIANDCIYHDLDAKGLGFERGHIPYTDYRIFQADHNIKAIALKTPLKKHSINSGRILTGDQFLTREEINTYNYLTKELDGDAVDMESAAVAHVASVNKIPFLIVRSISDKADDSASMDFQKFLGIAAENSFKVVNHVLDNI